MHSVLTDLILFSAFSQTYFNSCLSVKVRWIRHSRKSKSDPNMSKKRKMSRSTKSAEVAVEPELKLLSEEDYQRYKADLKVDFISLQINEKPESIIKYNFVLCAYVYS